MKQFKKLFPSFFSVIKGPSAIAKETLLNEIRTLKQAGKHPNIVTLIGTRIEGQFSTMQRLRNMNVYWVIDSNKVMFSRL